MNWQKLIIAFVVVYILGALFSYIFHGLLLGPTYSELSSIWRQDMDRLMWVQWVTALFYFFFFVFIFARGYEGRGIMEGVRFGLIIWGFYTIPSIYGQYMVYPLPYSLVLKWIFIDLFCVLIFGIVTALIYKPVEEKK